MTESMKPEAWLFRFNNGTCSIVDDAKLAAEIEVKLDANETVTKLYSATQLEKARREEREACAALVKAIRDNLGEISMRASIVYDACTVIEKAILTRNEK